MDSMTMTPRKTQPRPYLPYKEIERPHLCPICQAENPSDLARQQHMDETHPGWAADYVRMIVGHKKD